MRFQESLEFIRGECQSGMLMTRNNISKTMSPIATPTTLFGEIFTPLPSSWK